MSNPLLTLDDWLSWQMRVHPREIELGLDRVRTVWHALGAPSPANTVITVGGTNGKGSTVAFLEAILLAGGLRVGAFTSPHLLRYNERVRVQVEDASDQALIEAFARIEKARVDTALTYFEFGTLAALLIFAESDLDVAILEVGLGGRLDAVNIIDADAAIVTTVDLDHQDWLGNEREVIAVEKAGIFRAGKPAILGELMPPHALIDEAQRTGAQLFVNGRNFHVETSASSWRWYTDGLSLDLRHPRLDAACQHANAAAAIMALHALRDRVGWQPDAIAKGVAQARAPARLQRFPGTPELIIDVAHNPQSARILAEWLASHPCSGKTIAVFGALRDKDVEGIVAPLRNQVGSWHLAGLDADSERGLDPRDLLARIGDGEALGASGFHASVAAALEAARESSRSGDRIIAFGSFFVASAALRFARSLANNGC
jgi:dihydrofolate synthase / folylpolyglutamate synthase